MNLQARSLPFLSRSSLMKDPDRERGHMHGGGGGEETADDDR